MDRVPSSSSHPDAPRPAEARAGGARTARSRLALPAAAALPSIDDLLSRVRFSPEVGHIWLDDRRMFLLHSEAFGALRRELIESLGVEVARGLLTRMGYVSGSRDAQLARKIRNKQSVVDAFSVGPQLHALEGVVLVEPLALEIDVERGVYYGEYLWRESIEDEAHIAAYGVGAEPVCWMQVGYASGYTSAFMGRSIVFREVECRSTGAGACRIVGRPADEWEDVDEDLRFLEPQRFANREIRTSAAPARANGGAGAGVRPARADESATADADPEIDRRKLVGASAGFNVVCHMIQRVADTPAPVLLLGETGVGKEIFARALHAASRRADAAFIAVNCAAIPEALIESELFGVERGAFTGANASRPGRFERAHGGTLFLDEIGCLSLASQSKLLRALQEGEIERVGDTRTRKVDVRVVAATNEDLAAAVERGAFRSDLYFRLNVFPIQIPPLRERKEDIPVLLDYFLRRLNQQYGRGVTGFTERAMDLLLCYRWPGNVRELENVMERAVILADPDGAIDVSHLPTVAQAAAAGRSAAVRHIGVDGSMGGSVGMDAGQSDMIVDPAQAGRGETRAGAAGTPFPAGFSDTLRLDEMQLALMRAAIARHHGNLTAAAKELGITRPQLAYRARKLDLWDMRRKRS